MMDYDREWPPIIAVYEHMDGFGFPEKVWISPAGVCRACERVTHIFINRMGQTLCQSCDMHAERERLQVN